MALDEQKDEDTTVEEDGIEFLVEKELDEDFASFNIDYSDDGFKKGFTVTCDLK